MRELTAAAEASAASSRAEQQRLAKELYVGNLPPNMVVFNLIDKLNDVLLEMGATTMTGMPILSGWLGGEGQFAFLQFRTVEECNNALSLNGFNLDGYQLKVGRPKGAGGALTNGPISTMGAATQFSLDDMPGLGLSFLPPLEESTKIERLVLVGAPMGAPTHALERIVSESGTLSFSEEIVESKIGRKSLIFEFEEVANQRKVALRPLVYDRDYALAVVRQEEAVAAGFMSVQQEQFTKGLGDKCPGQSRAVWLCGFAPISQGLEADFINEVRDLCDGFGPVETLRLFHVSKDNIRGVPGVFSDNEPVVVVLFENTRAAYRCKRYVRGASCFFLEESKLNDEDIVSFEPYYVDVQTPNMVECEELNASPPVVRGGKIVSAEASIIEANKRRKREKLAPEEMEIID